MLGVKIVATRGPNLDVRQVPLSVGLHTCRYNKGSTSWKNE